MIFFSYLSYVIFIYKTYLTKPVLLFVVSTYIRARTIGQVRKTIVMAPKKKTAGWTSGRHCK